MVGEENMGFIWRDERYFSNFATVFSEGSGGKIRLCRSYKAFLMHLLLIL